MTENTGLIEPSFEDATTMIAASELPEQLKRHLTTSLRQFGKSTGRPLAVIPARYSAVRNDLANWHHAPCGLTPKTVMNHRSNVKRALLYLSQEKGIPRHGAPLTGEREKLRAHIGDSLIRSRLSSFIRYCSANKISPEEVDETIVDRFLEYRNRCSKPANDAFRRLLARAWNANIGGIPQWPKQRLVEPPVKSVVETKWEKFPKGLRRDVDRYLTGLTKIRKSRTGRHIKPLRLSTIHGRRAELQAAARLAVKTGIPIEKLDSLRSMLKPKVAEPILDAYWQKNGEKPKLYTIDLARRFVAIAKETKCLNDRDCEKLVGMWWRLNAERPEEGLTEKNLAFLRKVLTPGVWGRVVKLPFAMMEEARRQRNRPIRAAVIAQKAVAIAIEAVAPVRLANLTSIRLGTNLAKPDGPNSNYWLHFTPEDTFLMVYCCLLGSIATQAQSQSQNISSQDFDFACAVASGAEMGANKNERNLQTAEMATTIFTFYIGRLSGRDNDTTDWNAVIRGRVAELHEKARSPQLFNSCANFYISKIE
jgi:hypothetical protein